MIYQLIDESNPTNPINPYGRSKLMIEHILQNFYEAYGMKRVILQRRFIKSSVGRQSILLRE